MSAPRSIAIERELESYFDRLWPLMRSITGEGVRKTHDILGELTQLKRIEVPSGSQVFDWTVPKEWVVNAAYLIDPHGKRVLDIADNTLHLVNYSTSFKGRVSREELDTHLFSLPELPEAIPYVTSYYRERWGFCLTQQQRDALPKGDYEVVVDTSHFDGALTISEAVLPGTTDAEVLISTYTCHPSMANNELSGPLLAAFLARRISGWPKRRLTFRFVFLPETIGAIAYLNMRGEHLRKKLIAGYVATCVGMDTQFTYQRSQRADTLADRAALYALKTSGVHYAARDFRPTGSDERQYCSPGFNLPVGTLMRGPFSEYPEYHTSLDNKKLISFGALSEAVDVYENICRSLDCNETFKNTSPFGEPNLGKRGLYPTIGGKHGDMEHLLRAHAALWLCNQCDGARDLIAIAERSGISLNILHSVARDCVEKGLFEVVGANAI